MLEGFFYEACKLDYYNSIELLARRYSNIDYIMQMPAADFHEFFKIAKDKEREERIFAMWAQQMPFMSKDSFVSFDEYKDRVTGRNIDTRSTSELSQEIDEIERKMQQ